MGRQAKMAGLTDMRFFWCTFLALVLCASPAFAENYYVNNTHASTSDNNAGTSPSLPWQTIARCASTIVAGDTCNVVAGTYDARITETSDGRSGNPITYLGSGGATVRGFTLTGAEYIVIQGFVFTNSGMTSDPNASVNVTGESNRVKVASNAFTNTITSAVRCSKSDFLRVESNTVSVVGTRFDTTEKAFSIGVFSNPCNDALIEKNSISDAGDYVNAFGDRIVVRGNTFGPANPRNNRAHIDGVQNDAVATKVLYENNRTTDNNNLDNHVILNQVNNADHWIVRHNHVCRSNGGIDWRLADRLHFYNNTIVDTLDHFKSAFQLNFVSSTDNFARNNIFVNASSGNPYTGRTVSRDYDLWYQNGDPAETNDISADPLFVNRRTCDFNLQARSPARDSGGHLTTAAGAGSAGTTLTVATAEFFQDGWAGVLKDCIAVGTVTNTSCVSSIDYETDVITLTTPISWSDGAPVWLYSNSSGEVVLRGRAPDRGAYEYSDAAGADR
jgi:hypothetical protein